MTFALGRWPGLVPGTFTCANCGGTVIVDGEAVALCDKCSTPSEALLHALGFRKLPHPLAVTRMGTTTDASGGADNRERGKKIPPPPSTA